MNGYVHKTGHLMDKKKIQSTQKQTLLYRKAIAKTETQVDFRQNSETDC